MRIHSVLPWPPINFRPAKPSEKSRKSKAAEQKSEPLAVQQHRVPPPTDDDDDHDPSHEKIDILV
jgi:hypothetical protein